MKKTFKLSSCQLLYPLIHSFCSGLVSCGERSGEHRIKSVCLLRGQFAVTADHLGRLALPPPALGSAHRAALCGSSCGCKISCSAKEAAVRRSGRVLHRILVRNFSSTFLSRLPQREQRIAAACTESCGGGLNAVIDTGYPWKIRLQDAVCRMSVTLIWEKSILECLYWL